MLITISILLWFPRQNEDLLMKMELSITEALCGFQKVISTLDSREIVITALPGDLLICRIYNEDMLLTVFFYCVYTLLLSHNIFF